MCTNNNSLVICGLFKVMYFYTSIVLIFSLLSESNGAIVSPNDECVPLEDCPQLLDLIKNKRDHFGTRNLLQILHCRHQGRQAYLRCVSQSKIREFMDKADLLPDEENCGLDDLEQKISGGNATGLAEYRWIALLRYKNASGALKYGCHANLISKKYLVTAAHCISRDMSLLKQKILGDVYSVVLGEYDVRNETDCIYYLYGKDCADEVKEYVIESYLVHPDYDPATTLNDIALIRLKKEVEFSDFIKPICLPPRAVIILSRNESWWIGGWGETADFQMNDVKQKAKFRYKGKEECFVSVKLTEKQLCAGSDGAAKTCPGDSGGPLMFQRKIGDAFKTFLLGVTSLGARCNSDAQITIFTKISAYMEWIITSLEK